MQLYKISFLNGKKSAFCGKKHSDATKLKIASSQRLRLSKA